MGTHFRKRGERGKRRPSGTWTRPLLRFEEQALDLLGVLAFLSKEEEEEERLLSPGMGGVVDSMFGSQLPATLSSIWMRLS